VRWNLSALEIRIKKVLKNLKKLYPPLILVEKLPIIVEFQRLMVCLSIFQLQSILA
jgi:hypothetical protein